MTKKEFENLEEGDIVRHKNGKRGYVVTGNYKKYVIAVDTVHLSNPDEWIKVDKRPLNHDVFIEKLNEFVESHDNTCDCGEPFPENGYCGYCGTHRR